MGIFFDKLSLPTCWQFVFPLKVHLGKGPIAKSANANAAGKGISANFSTSSATC